MGGAAAGHDERMQRASARAGQGRIVRWDAADGQGALVVQGEPAEVRFAAAAVQAPGGRALEPGELVEVEYASGDRGLVASRVCPTDEES